MSTFTELLQQSTAHAWLFIPSAILLGALHGLEPGHSKTMMAAFIVAVRGTVAQALMLGIAATVSHTAIVWVVALAGMYFWQGIDAEAIEPYFQLVSAAIIIGLALWMLWQIWRDQTEARAAAAHSHAGHHAHGADIRRIDTGHGVIAVELFDDGAASRWRVRNERGHGWRAADITMTAERPEGGTQTFKFVARDGFMESIDAIRGPHAFKVRLSLGHGGHSHDYDLAYANDRGHDHAHDAPRGLDIGSDTYQDAHERAHANDIRRRFANRTVTSGQVVLFGLTGGLIPCPAAITVLLLCLQLKEFSLGFVLVLCFSIGLAVTLVTVGAAAALSVRHATKRWGWFDTVARRAPYASSLLIIAVGLYIGVQGWRGLEAGTYGEPAPAMEKAQ
ncbi:nickel/cobalt efflux transporter [Rhizobium sp.]